jgi:zinc protease
LNVHSSPGRGLIVRLAGLLTATLTVLLASGLLAADGPVTSRLALSNGLTLVGREVPGSPTVAVNAFLRLSVLHERAGTAGIRQLTQMWLKDRPAEAGLPTLAAAIDDIGARYDAVTELDFIKVSLGAAATDFSTALALTKRAVFSDRFAPDAFEPNRRVCERLLEASGEMPLTLADGLLRDALFEGTARARSSQGEAGALAKLTPQQVMDFHRTHFLPGVTVLSIVGGVPWSEVTQQVSRVFGSVLPGPLPEIVSPGLPPVRPRTIRRNGAGETATVMLGGRAPGIGDPGYPAAALAVSVLGSGLGSRLYQALRENEPLAYSVEAEITPSNVAGTAEAYATCDLASADKVAAIIKAEVARLAKTPLDPAELDRRKQFVAGTYLVNRQRNGDVAHYLGLLETLVPGQCEALDASLLSRILATSPDAVSQAAQQLFAAPIVVIIGPEGKPPPRPGDDNAA